MRSVVGSFCALALPAVCAGAQGRATVAALPVVVDRIAPVTRLQATPGHVFLDFGQEWFGGLELRVPHPQAGAKLTVSLGEKLSAPGVIDRAPGGSLRFLTAEILLDADTTVYRVPLTANDSRLLPASVGGAMPFRYVEIDGATEGVQAMQLAVHYAFDGSAATFDSSDAKLNAVWALSKHTMEATSFAGIFIDGDRERKPYEADAYLNQLGWYSTTPDRTLPRVSWEYLIDHPTWPTEWSLFEVMMAREDLLYTGDTDGLRTFYPDLQAKTLAALERPDGLVVTGAKTPKNVVDAIHLNAVHVDTLRDLVDWPAGERDGYEMKPVNTVVNAFHALAMRQMGEIAAALGHADDAAKYAAAARRTTDSLNRELFDAKTGLYVDGEGSSHSSVHANLFPLAFGLVPPERQARVAAYLAERGMACSVYAAQFLMEALFDHGQADAARRLMTAPGDRSWSHMVDQGLTITGEAWDIAYKKNEDWNHAWGAAPANLIPRKLMGIEPAADGFKRISITPKMGSLAWAEMRVPAGDGSLWVRVETLPKNRVEVDMTGQVSARIGLPVKAADGSAKVLVDGRAATADVRNGTAFVDVSGPGRHVVSLP